MTEPTSNIRLVEWTPLEVVPEPPLLIDQLMPLILDAVEYEKPRILALVAQPLLRKSFYWLWPVLMALLPVVLVIGYRVLLVALGSRTVGELVETLARDLRRVHQVESERLQPR